MSKSIYEEAIENAQILMGLISLHERNAKKKLDMLNQIEKALEQAENQEKLLELYRYLNDNTISYDLHYDEEENITSKIDEIEKKIKELENE